MEKDLTVNAVAFIDFIDELQKEYMYQLHGGTSYRQKTAELSLEVARIVGNAAPFLEMEVAKQTVPEPSLTLILIESTT